MEGNENIGGISSTQSVVYSTFTHGCRIISIGLEKKKIRNFALSSIYHLEAILLI